MARFWSKVEVGANSDCWNWRGGSTGFGYGRFRLGGELRSPHRIAFEMANGSIPEGPGYHGIVVMHRCDNPACCNPAHLSLGTMSDNVRDMDAKGRRPKTRSITVSEGTVAAILRDPRPHRIVAEAHGVSKTYVGALKRGERRAIPLDP